jgi:hypothetical protein
VCQICREVTYPSITERILGCSGPCAPRPADVAGRVATEVPRLTLAPPPPPPEAGVARGAERPSSGVATTHRRALLVQGRAAARRPLLGVNGSAEAAG